MNTLSRLVSVIIIGRLTSLFYCCYYYFGSNLRCCSWGRKTGGGGFGIAQMMKNEDGLCQMELKVKVDEWALLSCGKVRYVKV